VIGSRVGSTKAGGKIRVVEVNTGSNTGRREGTRDSELVSYSSSLFALKTRFASKRFLYDTC
jgi:hypothetical protein